PLIELSEFADFGASKGGLAVLTAGVGEQSNAGGSIANLLIKGRNSSGGTKPASSRHCFTANTHLLANSPGDHSQAVRRGSSDRAACHSYGTSNIDAKPYPGCRTFGKQ